MNLAYHTLIPSKIISEGVLKPKNWWCARDEFRVKSSKAGLPRHIFVNCFN